MKDSTDYVVLILAYIYVFNTHAYVYVYDVYAYASAKKINANHSFLMAGPQ